ncbi:MAG: tRNA 2-thiouridine(34) synthase MnmA [SAR324 cluster bacterium]|nr:tRNA 2-thiouridine(34) synthase MnmA [SAR324 cluster bacterium]
MTSKRVAVAMSGGVDSSVSVALLKEQGYSVIGIHMKLYEPPSMERQSKSCCSLDDTLDARAVCSRLDVPFYVIDFRDEFKDNVIDYFVQEYLDGRTPNPCVMCNQKIKSQYLLEKADELGCDYLATGHYARILKDSASGNWQITRPRDFHKDQTYFLFGTPSEELPRLLFPLAEYSKPEVREIAERYGLVSAQKPDSQEICFVPLNYREFIVNQLNKTPEPGNFVSSSGEVLGRHKGIPYYTVGQRRGLQISGSTPYYVVQLDKKKNQIVLGKIEETFVKSVEVSKVNWVSIEPIEEPISVSVKLRYAHKAVKAKIIPQNYNRAQVVLEVPERSASPGQAAVFYQEDILLGGGWIDRCDA